MGQGSMIASPRLVFVHIMKTGGTTILERLAPYFDDAERCSLGLDPGDPESFVRRGRRSLGAVRLFEGHMPFGLHRWIDGAVRYFTFIRHPVDRVLSTYYFLRRPHANSHPLREILASNELEALFRPKLYDELPAVDRETLYELMSNHQTRVLSGRLRPPLEHLLMSPAPNPTPWTMEQLEVSERDLELAVANIREHFELVGTTEALDRGWLQLCELFGWPSVSRTERHNVTPDRPGAEALSAALRERIVAWNRQDLRLWSMVTSGRLGTTRSDDATRRG